MSRRKQIRVGSIVMIPWGPREIPARVLKVLGDPPKHLRIIFMEDLEDPYVIMVGADWVRLAS